MNIYELRQRLYVTNYYAHLDGANIRYVLMGNSGNITLTRKELISELILIGSIDEDANPEEQLDYQLSQWDALNIAIRFELARETEKELQNSDLFEAIAKITKPNI